MGIRFAGVLGKGLSEERCCILQRAAWALDEEELETPKVVGRASWHCCEWCSALAGSYRYPDVPKDVYRRHENCNCTVEYDPGSGKTQNIWTKAWTSSENSDILEDRSTIGQALFDYSNYVRTADGTIQVTRTVLHGLPNDPKPFEVIDVVTKRGDKNRTYYDGNCKRIMRIDSSDHGLPLAHPMGAHKHQIEYNAAGRYISDGKPGHLSTDDKKLNGDIL